MPEENQNEKKGNEKEHQLDRILLGAREMSASDVHFKIGYKPILRIHGVPQYLETEVVTGNIMAKIVKWVLINESKQNYLFEHRNVDSSLEFKGHRHRVNVAYSKGQPFVAIRLIPDKIIPASDIGFPFDVWEDIVKLKRGLVLVTGVTGSGKTTTLASLINEINARRHEHIITLEDPIEYVHKPLKSIISQREIGTDLHSFADGVKYALRQDPDVILVGEIRDPETALHALEATETGHVVFSTLHTKSAAETARRYVNIFDSEDHTNVRDSLASNLAYVLSQQLIPRTRAGGRRLAMEVMNVKDSSAMRRHLREGEYHKIIGQIQIEQNHKSILMDDHIKELYQRGDIELKDALAQAHNPEDLKKEIDKKK